MKSGQKSTDMKSESKYWFPAKKYGWGWGIPISWQGWIVVAAFFTSLFSGTFIFPLDTEPRAYYAFITVLSAVLVLVCWIKGEPPRWRWGNRELSRPIRKDRRPGSIGGGDQNSIVS